METIKQEEKTKYPKFLRYAVIAIVSLVAVIWLGKWLVYRITHVTTDAAFVKADIVSLEPLVSGHVKEIFVDEGVAVEAGQLLATLDDRSYQQALEKADATLRRAELSYIRNKKLHESRTISDAKFEDVEAAYKEAKAAREQASLNVVYTKLMAPFRGVIAKKYIDPGDFAAPGLPILAMYDPATLHVIANLEESKVKHVKLGADTDLFLDAYSGRLRGKVIRIGEATAAEFALIPRDVSAGEFTKVVQRVPIKISLPPREKYPFLKPGLSVTIGIEKVKS
jgi:membrane fusion protein (multidrug efflux system)